MNDNVQSGGYDYKRDFASLLMSIRQVRNLRRYIFLERMLFEKLYAFKKANGMPPEQNFGFIDPDIVPLAVEHFRSRIETRQLCLQYTLYANARRYTVHVADEGCMDARAVRREPMYDVRRKWPFPDTDNLHVFVNDMIDDCEETPDSQGVSHFMPWYIQEYFGKLARQEFECVSPLEGLPKFPLA